MGERLQVQTNTEEALSLIVNSGIYRHHTLRTRMREIYGDPGDPTAWDALTNTHWEVLYHLIECRLLGRNVVITDIPLGTGLSTSTSRRILRRLEEIGLATTTCDEIDKRRFNTELAEEYHQVVEDFVADYADGFVGLIQRHDKQERKVAQAALERTREELLESEARLLEAQMLASIGHWVWDEVQGEYLTISEELLRIYGVANSTKYDLTGRWQNRFTHPEDVDRVVAVETDAVKRGVGYESEYRIVRPDGMIRYVREIGAPRQDHKGHPIVATGTTQDITDRKEAERDNAMLATVIQNLGDAVEVTDANLRVVYVNPAHQSVTGYSASEAFGKSPSELHRPLEHDASFYDAMWNSVASGEVWTGDVVARTKDGPLREQAITVSGVRDNLGVLYA